MKNNLFVIDIITALMLFSMVNTQNSQVLISILSGDKLISNKFKFGLNSHVDFCSQLIWKFTNIVKINLIPSK